MLASAPDPSPYVDLKFALDSFLKRIRIGVTAQYNEVVAVYNKLEVMGRVIETAWGGNTLDESEPQLGSTVSLFPESGGSLGAVHSSLEPSASARTPDFGRKLDISGPVNARVEIRLARVDE